MHLPPAHSDTANAPLAIELAKLEHTSRRTVLIEQLTKMVEEGEQQQPASRATSEASGESPYAVVSVADEPRKAAAAEKALVAKDVQALKGIWKKRSKARRQLRQLLAKAGFTTDLLLQCVQSSFCLGLRRFGGFGSGFQCGQFLTALL